MVAAAWDKAEGEPQGFLARIIEAQRGRAFLWSPVAFTFGVWAYFALSAEPSMLAAVAMGLAAALLLIWRHFGIAMLVAAMLAGFALAKLRTELVATPMLRATSGEVQLTGQVIDSARRGSRNTLIVAPTSIADIPASEMPRRIRLSSLAKHGAPRPGDMVTAKVRLQPVPGPVMPGGFDFGRQLYFEGIGGTGRVTTAMTISEGPMTASIWLNRHLERVRNAINTRIAAVLKGDAAAIAEALIDGERGGISKDVNTSFQASGLAHVLSISGLHMSLVAGGVFWLVRALLALFPLAALRWPIKKIAAGAALGSGLFYMLLAGSEVATQRSYIMIAVVFLAVLVDRPALSLRNLAIAALIILLLQPEAAIQAGFQMSFLAVLGLAAFFEAWAEFRRTHDDESHQRHSLIQRAARKVAAAILISLATTAVAGFMSSIPAAFHFGRIAPYGILANALAIPVISLIVMPMGLLAALLMPLGLEAWPLWIMGQGLQVTMAISDWVVGLSGAKTVLPQQPAFAAMIMAFGAASLCLLKTRIRFAGIAILVAGAAFGAWRDTPDILINRTASNAALLNASGELVPVNARADRFAVERWLLANGEEATPAEAAKRTGWTCEKQLCRATVRSTAILYAREGAALPVDCTGITIVISAFPLRNNCKAVATRIDRFSVWRNGSHAIHIDGPEISVATSRALQGERPWAITPRARRGLQAYLQVGHTVRALDGLRPAASLARK